jgi:uncharacterized protein (TIGR00255 family)
MVQSMTGFGKAEVICEKKSYSIIVKSVNSKNADLNIKLPSLYRDKENEVRTKLLALLQRGKVDLYISSERSPGEQTVKINRGIFNAYVDDLKELSSESDISDDTIFKIASRLPNVLSQEAEEVDDNDWVKLAGGIDEAIEQLIQFRKKEGSVLEKDLSQRARNILGRLTDIEPFEQERIDTIKQRLESQLEQVDAEKINRDRFEQELIFYFEKFDITEEKVRLTAHCNLFHETMNEKESQGRKLGFISQEMGREINTIGSKANHSKIQQLVVEMKDELEKIKEQLFNIL